MKRTAFATMSQPAVGDARPRPGAGCERQLWHATNPTTTGYVNATGARADLTSMKQFRTGRPPRGSS